MEGMSEQNSKVFWVQRVQIRQFGRRIHQVQVILVGIGKDKFAILNGLLKNHGKCLDTESLQTLMVEYEAILNSRPLTVDTVIYVNNPAPLAPANILTMR